MKKLALLGLSLFAVLLAACSNQSGSDKRTIVTTFYPVYEFTKQIVGDKANVELLVEAGTEVHGFEPSAKDIATIEDADAFVYANENMETWVHDLEENLTKSKSGVKVISATEGMLLLPGSEDHHHDHDEEGHSHEYDPHVWVSPYRAIKMVKTIRDQLVEAYPDDKEAFTKNADAYIKKLEALDKKYSDTLSKAKQKSFVTQHAAFNYLALDYGLKEIAVSGLTPDAEPSATRLAELAEYIKKYDIKYIYFEETASSAVAETLAKETGVETAVLNPLESLTAEAMKAGEDYISTAQANLEALKLTTETEGTEVLPESGEPAKTVYAGYFEDSAVADRKLSDYAGQWQSVYPYLLDGSFDQVWDYKAKESNGAMTAAEYKDYYDVGYKTNVEKINIDGDTMEFIADGKAHKNTYKYVGYKILTYKKGNRGVRFLFEATNDDAGDYKYVQFSDHNIAPVKAGHFHIYFGSESQEKLLEEMDNWPTYYPVGMNAFEIAQEMLAH
ncbi:zinc ABC transporter substrate-binding protein AdcA [Streptococcus merionis]|uniref:Metal ABC transporter periplasmic protein n=1 Tax=Streptococcus merionis TaxID=400065 RepID=A0A239SY46_9STRE|nr:zinc ABC transporter substrate-binding protein AdcA [Streptococcus merionis]SNU90162.1 metal ABC transporter periplasmic protein [Streptococcus merionis]